MNPSRGKPTMSGSTTSKTRTKTTAKLAQMETETMMNEAWSLETAGETIAEYWVQLKTTMMEEFVKKHMTPKDE